MRCKECGQTKRGPRKELREVQLCGDCYNRRKNLKKDQVEHSERYKNWMRKNDLKRKMPKSNQLPDENNLDVKLDKAKSKPKEDEIPKSDELQRFEKALEQPPPTKKEFQSSIESLCLDIIKQHNSKTRTSNHNIELMEDMIEVYKQLGSLKKVSEVIGKSLYTLRQGFKNPIRLPQELRELLNNGKLASDPIMASAIAFYVTDWYQWDGEKEKEKAVVQTCKEVAKMMKENLEMRREFFATKDDYSKPVSHSNVIKEIMEEYPVPNGAPEWGWGDRTGKQYKRIIYSKNIDAIKFLRRWEFENKHRISKRWAFQMIDELIAHNNINKFLQEHEDEFQD